ncbi:MAG TPA: glycosyltransferase family 4 protein [Candidatus Paceibacterota bacterium]|nr:glycosyltransferase family 4 protein [Candidatus Paceibacterota bacterium]
MKIAQIAPIIERVPPKKYGGTERVIYELTEELVRRGHEVTLFASGDSLTSAALESVYPKSLREVKFRNLDGANIWTMMSLGLAYARHSEFDIIHDHNGHLSLPAANICPTPVVMTIHGPLNRDMRRIFQALRNPYLVTISQSQSYPAPNLHYAGTVYNGLSLEQYPFSDADDGYLLFVGRISMEKGVHLAIETAQELNLRLIIAAKLDPVDKPYFHEYIEPRLSEQIVWIGEVDEAERNRLMSKALCFLHPVTWREPFGLTLIEAMACGCPVVAFDKGSIPELIKTGETGFVVQDIEGMVEAVENIRVVNRAACRKHALEHFSAKKMADGYEEIYRKILTKEI